MSDIVKAAVILGVAVIAAAAIWVYYSPYQTCVRGEYARNNPSAAEIRCAAALGARR